MVWRPSTVRAADGVELSAESSAARAAATTVVFVHGWALSSASWAEESEAIGQVARVVRYDQRGHGRSGRLGGTRPSIDLLGEDLEAVLDQLAPEGPVVLAGHSMGGMTIMAVAARHPELLWRRVRGVAMVGTSAGGLRAGTLGLSRPAGWIYRPLMALTMWWWRRWPGPAERLRARFPRRQAVRRAARRFLFGPDASEEAVAACTELIQATPAETVGAFYAALMEHDKQEAVGRLREVPVLIMVGELDRLTPPRHSQRLAAALPGARLVVVPGCGHLLPMERPAVVTEHLCELLERVGREGARPRGRAP